MSENYCCLHQFKHILTQRLCQNLTWYDTFDFPTYDLYNHGVWFNEVIFSNSEMPSDSLILFRVTLEIIFPSQEKCHFLKSSL